MDLEYYQGVLFVRLEGNLTRKNTYRINNYLVPVLLKHRIKFLVYNLFSVLLVDRAGVDAFIRTKLAIKKNQGEAYFCEVPEHLKNVVRKVRMKETTSEKTALELLKI